MKVAVTTLVFCVASLLALGMVMLYSSSMAEVNAGSEVHAGYLAKQLIWCILGVTACVAATVMDYRQLKRIWWVPLCVAVLMLALVLNKHFGARLNGARRWFRFGGLNFQPSEFAKLALLIAVAWYGEYFQRQMPQWKRGLLIPGLLIGLTVGLIFKEPDVGNALVLAAVSGIMLLIGGIRLRYFLPPLLATAIGVGVFIYYNPVRSDRIHSWLHVEETRRKTGHQAYEAMVALGSGGLTGKGLGDSRQKLGFVPLQFSDFIFSIIGEELGLIASLLVIAAFVAIIFCGIYIAMNAADTFGLLLGSGITFLIGLQAFINIGVVTGTLPNKGLPLPFISQGGSNLLLMLTSVGLLLSIARLAREAQGGMRNITRGGEVANPFAQRRQSQP